MFFIGSATALWRNRGQILVLFYTRMVLVIALRPQTPKHIRGGLSHYTDTSEPVDGNQGLKIINTSPNISLKKSILCLHVKAKLSQRKEVQSHPIIRTITHEHILGICIAPTPTYWAALGAERRLCYPGKTAVNHNGRSRTATYTVDKLRQQQARTKSRLIATAGLDTATSRAPTHRSVHTTKSPTSQKKICTISTSH
jgi:hypothetical protein